MSSNSEEAGLAGPRWWFAWPMWWVRLALFLALTLAVQWSAGAYQSEGSGEPDEPAHIVTGLMVRDYLAGGLGSPPMEFARDYYRHYPKVALGHWPPAFYLEQAVWTLVFPATRSSLLVMIALMAALLAAATYSLLRELTRSEVAFCACFVMLTLPGIASASSQVMTEIPQAVAIAAAMIAFSRYLDAEHDSHRPAHLAAFAAWSVISLLTKGTALVLAPMPVLAIGLAGRWDLLRRPSLWMAAAAVVVLTAPWYLLAPGALHERVAPLGGLGWQSRRISLSYFWAPRFGWAISILVLMGIAALLARRWRGWPVRGSQACAVALVLTGSVFSLLVGVWTPRHQVELAAAMLLLATTGALGLASLVPLGWRSRRGGFVAAVVAAAGLVAWNLPASHPQSIQGYARLARTLTRGQAGSARTVLVSADALGEGLLISGIAQVDDRPGRYILRASKLLADVSWLGDSSRERFTTQPAMEAYLNSLPLDAVVLDRARPPPFRYGRLLEESVAGHPEDWQPVNGGDRTRFAVFLRKGRLELDAGQLRARLTEAVPVPE